MLVPGPDMSPVRRNNLIMIGRNMVNNDKLHIDLYGPRQIGWLELDNLQFYK